MKSFLSSKKGGVPRNFGCGAEQKKQFNLHNITNEKLIINNTAAVEACFALWSSSYDMQFTLLL